MEMLNFKTKITEHGYLRLRERLNKMCKDNDITVEEYARIERNLNNILEHEFDSNKSYGIMLGSFLINSNSKLITSKHKSGVYYEILSIDRHDVFKDSTGNEIWAIIRNGCLVTVFLRKTVQRSTAEQPRDFGGLGVDVVIDRFNKYL